MLVTTFEVRLYVQPALVKPVTVNVTAIDFLLSDELVTLHLPAALVVQVVAPDPADQVPATETPATGTVAPTTAIVTVAVQPFRPDVAFVAERLPTHFSLAGAGALTVTVELASAVAPPSSVTVRATV